MDRRSLLLAAPAAAFAAGLGLGVGVTVAAADDWPDAYAPRLALFKRQAASPGPMQMGALQGLAQMYATCGDEAQAFRCASRAFGSAESAPAPDISGARALDALDAIVEASKGRRVVILNEAHHISRTRAFARRVAARLRQEGFTHYAAETFEPTMASKRPGDPIETDQDGYYTDDPVYAELVRALLRDGWKLRAYEARPDQNAPPDAPVQVDIATREEAEAANFTDILTKDPGARVLVHCGHSHVSKLRSHENVWFAARLAAKVAGLDPLCIDQQAGSPAPDPTLDRPLLKAVLDRFQPTRSMAVFDKAGRPLSSLGADGGVDLAIYHPRAPQVEGRPGWLTTDGPSRRVAIPLPPSRSAELTLIQAVRRSELARSPRTVPSDQYPIAPGAAHAVLWLEPDDYLIRLETTSGRRTLQTSTVA